MHPVLQLLNILWPPSDNKIIEISTYTTQHQNVFQKVLGLSLSHALCAHPSPSHGYLTLPIASIFCKLPNQSKYLVWTFVMDGSAGGWSARSIKPATKGYTTSEAQWPFPSNILCKRMFVNNILGSEIFLPCKISTPSHPSHCPFSMPKRADDTQAALRSSPPIEDFAYFLNIFDV